MTILSSRLVRTRGVVAVVGVLVIILHPFNVGGQQTQPRPPLNAYLDSVALAYLKERAGAIAKIQTRADAESRKAAVRQTVLRLIGGLPAARRPPAVRHFG